MLARIFATELGLPADPDSEPERSAADASNS
jgi:hypothetical protein